MKRMETHPANRALHAGLLGDATIGMNYGRVSR